MSVGMNEALRHLLRSDGALQFVKTGVQFTEQVDVLLILQSKLGIHITRVS